MCEKMDKLSNLNHLLFERILTEDYEDTAKHPAASNNYAI